MLHCLKLLISVNFLTGFHVFELMQFLRVGVSHLQLYVNCAATA